MTSQRGGVDGGLGLVGNGGEEAGHGGAEERAMTGTKPFILERGEIIAFILTKKEKQKQNKK